MEARQPGFERKAAFRKTQGAVLYAVFLGCVLVGIAGLVTLLVQVLVEGVPWLSVHLLTDYPSRHPEQARAEGRDIRDGLDHGADGGFHSAP